MKLYKRVIIGLIALMILLIVIGLRLPDGMFTTNNTKSNNGLIVTNNLYITLMLDL